MHLAIDIRESLRRPMTGKGRWAAGFVTELLRRDIPLTLYADSALPDDVDSAWKRADVRVISKRGLWWHYAVIRNVLRDTTIDMYVSTTSYIVPCLLRGRKPCVTVVHDLIAFRDEPHDKRASLIEHVTLQIAVRHSSLICTTSDATADDLRRKIPAVSDKIVPVYAGCDRTIATHPTDGSGPVVCIGTLCPRKNQLRLINAYVALPDDLQAKYPLVLIGGRGWDDQAVIDAARSTAHVSWKDRLTDADRDSILADAVLCAFPSLYEGFGLPVLEAFAAGVPVLTSHGGSLAEVAADAAMIVDPLDEQSIRHGLATMLENAALRDSFAQKGLKRAELFTWKKTVDVFLAALR